MSVEAFIVREDVIWVDKERMIIQNNNDGDNLVEYVHKEEEFCIDIWKQDNLINEMFKYGANDYTNSEYVGIIEMDYDFFYEMYVALLDNSEMDLSDDDKDSINKIKEYLDESGSNVVRLNCR